LYGGSGTGKSTLKNLISKIQPKYCGFLLKELYSNSPTEKHDVSLFKGTIIKICEIFSDEYALLSQLADDINYGVNNLTTTITCMITYQPVLIKQTHPNPKKIEYLELPFNHSRSNPNFNIIEDCVKEFFDYLHVNL
jgi:ABC-type oligopeptide transport system ATPase subunit